MKNDENQKIILHLKRFPLIYKLLLLLCGVFVIMGSLRAYQAHSEKLVVNSLEKDVARIDIKGYHFNVPLLYMEPEHAKVLMKAERRWLMPNKARSNNKWLFINALLWDMKPFFLMRKQHLITLDDDDKLLISISYWENDKSSPWEMGTRVDNEERSLFYKKESDSYGLVHYAPINSVSFDKYYPTDGSKFRIVCDYNQPVTSPRCNVSSYYASDLYLEYSYSIRYLSNWHEIDTKVRALLDHFQHAARAEASNQTQGQ